MKTLLEMLAAAASGLFMVLSLWLAVEIDNAELKAGKSPHSGFTPSCPKIFDGFAKPSRSTRIVESNNQ
ncbi:hypothetical protein ABGM91_11405 [Akkermansia muciniphila]|uniref:hypothetical protein n=1 Tax=Akkermansia muciniphila TaxID=239935 RepID=UPI0033BED2A2